LQQLYGEFAHYIGSQLHDSDVYLSGCCKYGSRTVSLCI